MTLSVTIKNQSIKRNHKRDKIGSHTHPSPQSGRMSKEIWLIVLTGGHRKRAATELTFNLIFSNLLLVVKFSL